MTYIPELVVLVNNVPYSSVPTAKLTRDKTTGNQKRSNSFAIIPEPHPAQLSAPAQKECPSKNVRGLKAVSFQVSHLLP